MEDRITVTTYRVPDVTWYDLLERLYRSLYGEPAVFNAEIVDMLPSKAPVRRHFEVRLQSLHANSEPYWAEVLDQDNKYFQIWFHKDSDELEFEIIT